MSVRELIKHLEACDLDKDVAVVVSILSSDSDNTQVLLREIKAVAENEVVVAIQ